MAIRIGLGSENDTITKSEGTSSGTTDMGGVYFAGPGVLEPESGNAPHDLSGSNRYILLKPKYGGVLKFQVRFSSANNKNNFRVYSKTLSDLSDISDVDSTALAGINKDSKDSVMAETTGTGYTSATLTCESNTVYAIYTYNNSPAYINNIEYTSDSITAPAMIDGEATKFTEGATDGKYTGSDNSVAVAYTTQFTNSTDNTTYVTPEIVWTVNNQVGKTVKHSIISNLKSGETTDKYGLVIYGDADDANDITSANVSVQLAPHSTITEETSGGE